MTVSFIDYNFSKSMSSPINLPPFYGYFLPSNTLCLQVWFIMWMWLLSLVKLCLKVWTQIWILSRVLFGIPFVENWCGLVTIPLIIPCYIWIPWGIFFLAPYSNAYPLGFYLSAPTLQHLSPTPIYTIHFPFYLSGIHLQGFNVCFCFHHFYCHPDFCLIFGNSSCNPVIISLITAMTSIISSATSIVSGFLAIVSATQFPVSHNQSEIRKISLWPQYSHLSLCHT